MNQVNIVGLLTRESELRYTPNGVAVINNGVAVRRDKERTDFINIVAFNKTAELIANYFSKGSEIGLTGSIQTGSYEKDGKKVYTTDVLVEKIHFTRGNKQNEQQPTRRNEPPRNTKVDDDPFANGGQTIDISDDSLPF